jgi:hypothetical protein
LLFASLSMRVFVATHVKHLSGAPLKGRLLALPTNNRLGWKGLPGENTSL